MGSIWLRDAHTVIRGGVPAQFPVLTVPGWENRSNASGGFEAMKGLVVHHTASGPSADGWPDVNYETFHDAEAPNAMLKVSRRGEIFIMTAGSANTQGLGGPIIGVPLNRGNFQLIGIELSNNGVGEPYPRAQQDATVHLCRALIAVYGARYGWNHNSVISHFEWAPARKNDPAGPSRWSPGGGRWNMNAFRNELAQEADMPVTDAEMDAIAAKAAKKVWEMNLKSESGLSTSEVTASRWLTTAGDHAFVANQTLSTIDPKAIYAAVTKACAEAIAANPAVVDANAIATAVLTNLNLVQRVAT